MGGYVSFPYRLRYRAEILWGYTTEPELSDGTGTGTGIPEFSTGKMRYGTLSKALDEWIPKPLKLLKSVR